MNVLRSLVVLFAFLFSTSVAHASKRDSVKYKYKFDVDLGQLLSKDIRASFGLGLSKKIVSNLELGFKLGEGNISYVGGSMFPLRNPQSAQTWYYGSLGLEFFPNVLKRTSFFVQGFYRYNFYENALAYKSAPCCPDHDERDLS